MQLRLWYGLRHSIQYLALISGHYNLCIKSVYLDIKETTEEPEHMYCCLWESAKNNVFVFRFSYVISLKTVELARISTISQQSYITVQSEKIFYMIMHRLDFFKSIPDSFYLSVNKTEESCAFLLHYCNSVTT